MKHSEVLKRYVNTGLQIPEKQYERLSVSLRKSYKRMRGVVGYKDWEWKYLTDDERIKIIENKGEELKTNDIENLLEYSNDIDIIATKIIDTIGEKLNSYTISRLFSYSKDKYLITTKIIDVKGETPNDDSSETIKILLRFLNEIKRINQIMR
jgi:hypothetical protein